MRSSAVLSPCGLYRYHLSRRWDEAGHEACFIMLNPSTADASEDDPTIRRCVGFSRAWGLGALVVVNLYAYRATDPKALWRAARRLDIVGPENDYHIKQAVEGKPTVIAAWGALPRERWARSSEVKKLIVASATLSCLGKTSCGNPRHPLYLKSDLTPVPL